MVLVPVAVPFSQSKGLLYDVFTLQALFAGVVFWQRCRLATWQICLVAVGCCWWAHCFVVWVTFCC